MELSLQCNYLHKEYNTKAPFSLSVTSAQVSYLVIYMSYTLSLVIMFFIFFFNFSHKKIFWLVILAVLLSLVIFELLWWTNLYNKLLSNPLYILEVGTRITKSLKILEYCLELLQSQKYSLTFFHSIKKVVRNCTVTLSCFPSTQFLVLYFTFTPANSHSLAKCGRKRQRKTM